MNETTRNCMVGLTVLVALHPIAASDGAINNDPRPQIRGSARG